MTCLYRLCLIFSFLWLPSIPLLAATKKQPEPDVLSIMAERLPKRALFESVSLIIENGKRDKRAILNLNSNFIFPMQEKVLLGQWETDDLRKMEFYRLYLIRMQKTMAADRKDYSRIDPVPTGGVKVFVGGFEMDPYAAPREDALTFLEKVWEMAHWRPVDALEIRKKAGSKDVFLRLRGRVDRVNTVKVDQLNCVDATEKLLYCIIPKYGSAYLLK